MTIKIIVPLEEKAVLEWLRAAAASCQSNLGTGQRSTDDTTLLLQGMMLACKSPELAWAMLQCLATEATDGLTILSEMMLDKFQFVTPEKALEREAHA